MQTHNSIGYAGNVEILHDGKWGSVCDDEWDYLEANVVCRQLGFDGAIKPTANGHFGQARSEIFSIHFNRYFSKEIKKRENILNVVAYEMIAILPFLKPLIIVNGII